PGAEPHFAPDPIATSTELTARAGQAPAAGCAGRPRVRPDGRPRAAGGGLPGAAAALRCLPARLWHPLHGRLPAGRPDVRVPLARLLLAAFGPLFPQRPAPRGARRSAHLPVTVRSGQLERGQAVRLALRRPGELGLQAAGPFPAAFLQPVVVA